MNRLRGSWGLFRAGLMAGALWVIGVAAIERPDQAWTHHKEAARAEVPIDAVGKRLNLPAGGSEDAAKQTLLRVIRAIPDLAAYCRANAEGTGDKVRPQEMPAPCVAIPDTRGKLTDADYEAAIDSILVGAYRYSPERQAYLAARDRLWDVASTALIPPVLLLAFAAIVGAARGVRLV